MHIRLSGLLVAGCIAIAQPARVDAQENQVGFSVAGYNAIVATPLGGLPPLLSRDLVMTDRSPAVLHLRYGLRRQDSVNTHTFAATREFGIRRARAGVTAGIRTNPDATMALFGAEYQSVFSRGTLTPDPTGPILVLSMKFEVGFGTVVEGELKQTALAGGFSIPMSVPIGSDIVIVPFLAPGLHFGMLSSAGVTEAQPQVTVNGGLAIHNPSRLDLTLGVNRVLLREARTVYGVGLTWNR